MKNLVLGFFKVVLKTSEEEKLRQAELQKKENQPIVLNGRAALAAGKDDMSSSEDDDEGSTRHKFSQPNHVQIMIESKYKQQIINTLARREPYFSIF